MKKLGIIGGLGPMATAYLLELIINMTQAETDQQHIESIIYNCPWIPDRTQFILKKSACSPLPAMTEAGQRLAAQEVSQIAIPCITAHYFHKELEEAIGLPIIHAISETAKYLAQRNCKTVGIMATDGTVQTGLFSAEFEKYGIQCVYPSASCQAYVMDLIYKEVKAGKPVSMEKFRQVSQELFAAGAQTIVLGCTELSMIKRDHQLPAGYLDVLEVLAKCCVEQCGQLKEAYKELITT